MIAKQVQQELPSIIIKPYTLGELAHIYNVTTHTVRTWLKAHEMFIGKRIGRTYTTLQVKIIYERLGFPGAVEEG
jgi:hypothetical protein